MRWQRGGLVAILLGVVLPVGAGVSTIVPAAAAPNSFINYNVDPGHTGNDTSEPSMSGVSKPAWSSSALDGRVYGQPLVANDTVYVATQRNTVYAFDVAGGLRWSVALSQSPFNLPAVPHDNVTAAAGVNSGCGNIDPLGAIGTPVIDPARGSSGTIFVAVETWDGSNNTSIRHELVAVDLATRAVTHAGIDPVGFGFDTGAKRALEQERGALALAGGRVVVPFGGLSGDCGAYHGFVSSLPENLTGSPSAFEVNAPTAGVNAGNTGGGIWAAGGPAVDASGNVYVATGNGFEPNNSTYAYTDGIVKLSPTMAVLDYFGPTVWRSDDGADADLGSQGPVLVPRASGNPLVFTTGKQLTGYLLDSGALSSHTNHVGGELFQATACNQSSFGSSAYLPTSPGAGYLYVPCGEGVRALSVNTSTPSFARAWIGPADATGPPVIAGGVVWVHGSGRLYGLDPANGAVLVRIAGVDTAYNFSSPSAGSGELFYVGNNTVAAYTGNCGTTPGSYEQWSGWAPLQGASRGRVAVGTNQDGRLEALTRSTDGTIWHAWQQAPNGPWSAWFSLGGSPAGDPALGRNADGRLEAFAVGTDGGLWHAWQVAPGAGWSGWYPLGGSLAGRPAVTSNQDGRLEVLTRGTDGAAWHAWQVAPNSGWSAMYSLGGTITGDPSVAANSDGRIEAFGRGADGGILHVYQVAANRGWSPWASLGGATAGSPAAAANTDGRLQVFLRGTDNVLYYVVQVSAGGAWSGFNVVGGAVSPGALPVDSDPSVGRNLDGRLQVFASVLTGGPGGYDQPYMAWQSAAGKGIVCWGGLSPYGSTAPLGVGTDADGRLEVFLRGSDATVWHAWEQVPNGGWTG